MDIYGRTFFTKKKRNELSVLCVWCLFALFFLLQDFLY